MEVYNAMVVPMTYESWMLIEKKKARLQATDKRIEKGSRSDQVIDCIRNNEIFQDIWLKR